MLHTPLNYRGLLVVGASESCFRGTANCRSEVLVTSGLVRTEGKKHMKLRDLSQPKFRDSKKYPATSVKLHITKTEEEMDRRNFRFFLVVNL